MRNYALWRAVAGGGAAGTLGDGWIEVSLAAVLLGAAFTLGDMHQERERIEDWERYAEALRRSS